MGCFTQDLTIGAGRFVFLNGRAGFADVEETVELSVLAWIQKIRAGQSQKL